MNSPYIGYGSKFFTEGKSCPYKIKRSEWKKDPKMIELSNSKFHSKDWELVGILCASCKKQPWTTHTNFVDSNCFKCRVRVCFILTRFLLFLLTSNHRPKVVKSHRPPEQTLELFVAHALHTLLDGVWTLVALQTQNSWQLSVICKGNLSTTWTFLMKYPPWN